MGISSNQARFLSLTSRQVDLENRVQQICQRRLRLSSELEKVATGYNNSIGDRKIFTPSAAGIQNLSLDGLQGLGFKVLNKITNSIVTPTASTWANPIAESSMPVGFTAIHNITELQNAMTSNPAGKYMLMGNMDASSLTGPLAANFTGTFDGNGYKMTGLNLNSTASTFGLFNQITGGNIKNLEIEGANVSSTGNTVGILAGRVVVAGVIDTVHRTGSSSVSSDSYAGGLVGRIYGGTVSNSDSTANVNAVNGSAGGLTSTNAATITGSYSTGTVTNTGVAGTGTSGGITGYNTGTITNSYATGSINNASTTGATGGLVGQNSGTITSSYAATGTVTGGNAFETGGFSGWNSGGTVDNTNFYSNNMTADSASSNAVDGDVVAHPNWSAIPEWNTSGALPTLIRPTYAAAGDTPETLEQKIRNGEYSLIREADEYTQSPINLAGENYEAIDWRTVPGLYDELYKANDISAEDKYDHTISEINAQDKKLQLEQTSIEVEYKAVSSEKDAVKKILDTNASASFKYFG